MENNPSIEVKVTLIEEQLKELREQNRDYEKRLTAIETSREKTEYQYTQIMKAIDKLNDVTIPSLLRELEKIKNKPAKRWETGVNAIISGIVAVIISLIFKGVK